MKGLHHVGITVNDLDESIRFYHDVLGLQFSNEPSPWFESPELGPAVGVRGAALRQVSLLLGDTMLELLEYKSPPSERLPTMLLSLVRHLHAFAREVELTEAEWRVAIDALTATGRITDDQRQEFILWSDALGLSMLVDAMAHAKPPGATESTVLGP